MERTKDRWYSAGPRGLWRQRYGGLAWSLGRRACASARTRELNRGWGDRNIVVLVGAWGAAHLASLAADTAGIEWGVQGRRRRRWKNRAMRGSQGEES
jgi:hypothetical protein